MKLATMVLIALSLAAASCGGDAAKKSDFVFPPPPAAKEQLPAGLVVTASPGKATDVAAAKAAAKEGDEIVIRGRIGGSGDPFVEGIAAMTIVDPVLVPCNEMTMEDGCTQPWDYCCSSPDEMTKSTATIRVVGASGNPVLSDLRHAGLSPLSTVVVKGRVGPRPDPKVLVIDATAIFVEKK